MLVLVGLVTRKGFGRGGGGTSVLGEASPVVWFSFHLPPFLSTTTMYPLLPSLFNTTRLGLVMTNHHLNLGNDGDGCVPRGDSG